MNNFFRKTAKVLFGLLAVLIVIIVYSAWNDPAKPASVADVAPKHVGLGDVGIIQSGFPAGTSESGQDRVIQANTAKDQDGLNELIASGDAIVVDNNTKVKVIENGMMTKKVRLLSGDHKGKAVYVPSELIESL